MRTLRSRLSCVAVAALVLAVAACESAPAPVAVVQAPTPPPPPPAPTLSLAPRVIELASAYQSYVRQASNISPTFTDGGAVHASLRAGAAYEPKQLASGQIAYAAVVALQDPTFVAAVRSYAVSDRARVAVRDNILKDPAYVVAIKGSDSAAGLVVAALNGEGGRVRGVGELVKQAAYDVQRQAWSKARIPTPELRLAEAKTLSSTPIAPTAEDTDRLNQAALGTAPLPVTGQALPPPYTPVVVRGMAIAALAVLGEATEANAAYLDALVDDPYGGGKCLNMSKLNLYQCLSVARPWYEDVFCLGQHVLIDTGQCIAKGAGDLPPPAPLVLPTPTSATLQTPMPAVAADAAATPAAAFAADAAVQ